MESFEKQLEEVTPRAVLRQNLRLLDPQKTPAVLAASRKRKQFTSDKPNAEDKPRLLKQGTAGSSKKKKRGRSSIGVKAASLSMLEANVSTISRADQTYANLSISEVSSANDSIDIQAVASRLKARTRRALSQRETAAPSSKTATLIADTVSSKKGNVSTLADRTYANISTSDESSMNESIAVLKAKRFKTKKRKSIAKVDMEPNEWEEEESMDSLSQREEIEEILSSKKNKKKRRTLDITLGEQTYNDLSRVDDTSSDSISLDSLKGFVSKKQNKPRIVLEQVDMSPVISPKADEAKKDKRNSLFDAGSSSQRSPEGTSDRGMLLKLSPMSESTEGSDPSKISAQSPRRSPRSDVSPESPRRSRSDVSPRSPRKSPRSDVSPQSPRKSRSNVSPQSPGKSPRSVVSPQSPRKSPRSDVSPQSPRKSPRSDVSPQSPRKSPRSDVSPQSPRKSPRSEISIESPKKSPRSEVSSQSPQKSILNIPTESSRKSLLSEVSAETPRGPSYSEVSAESPRRSHASMSAENPKESSRSEVLVESPKRSSRTSMLPKSPRRSLHSSVSAKSPRRSLRTSILPENPRSSRTSMSAESPKRSLRTSMSAESPRRSSRTSISTESPRRLSRSSMLLESSRRSSRTSMSAESPKVSLPSEVLAESPRKSRQSIAPTASPQKSRYSDILAVHSSSSSRSEASTGSPISPPRSEVSAVSSKRSPDRLSPSKASADIQRHSPDRMPESSAERSPPKDVTQDTETAEVISGGMSPNSLFGSSTVDSRSPSKRKSMRNSSSKYSNVLHEDSKNASTLEESLENVQASQKLKSSQRAPKIQLNISSLLQNIREDSVIEDDNRAEDSSVVGEEVIDKRKESSHSISSISINFGEDLTFAEDRDAQKLSDPNPPGVVLSPPESFKDLDFSGVKTTEPQPTSTDYVSDTSSDGSEVSSLISSAIMSLERETSQDLIQPQKMAVELGDSQATETVGSGEGEMQDGLEGGQHGKSTPAVGISPHKSLKDSPVKANLRVSAIGAISNKIIEVDSRHESIRDSEDSSNTSSALRRSPRKSDVLQEDVRRSPRKSVVLQDDVRRPPRKSVVLEEDIISPRKSVVQEDIRRSPRKSGILQEDVGRSPRKSVVQEDIRRSPRKSGILQEDVGRSPRKSGILQEDVRRSPRKSIILQEDVRSPRKSGIVQEDVRRSPRKSVPHENVVDLSPASLHPSSDTNLVENIPDTTMDTSPRGLGTTESVGTFQPKQSLGKAEDYDVSPEIRLGRLPGKLSASRMELQSQRSSLDDGESDSLKTIVLTEREFQRHPEEEIKMLRNSSHSQEVEEREVSSPSRSQVGKDISPTTRLEEAVQVAGHSASASLSSSQSGNASEKSVPFADVDKINNNSVSNEESSDDEQINISVAQEMGVDVEPESSEDSDEDFLNLIPVTVTRIQRTPPIIQDAEESEQQEESLREEPVEENIEESSPPVESSSAAPKELKQMTMGDFLKRLAAKPPPRSAVYNVKETQEKMKELLKGMQSVKAKPLKGRPAKGKLPKKGEKKKVPTVPKTLPMNVTKEVFTHFAKCRVNKEVMEQVMKVSERFWSNTSKDLVMLAQTKNNDCNITKEVVFNLMKRQGFVEDEGELQRLVEQYLPAEAWEVLIPTRYGHNKVFPPEKD